MGNNDLKDNKADIAKKTLKEKLSVFERFLRKNEFKITDQRLLVAEKVFSLQTHFTVDSLFDLFQEKRGKISKATLYRILSLMVEAKVLREHYFGKDYKFYEQILGRHGNHNHIICTNCNKIIEFLSDEIENLQNEVVKRHNFQLKERVLNLYGYCSECQNE